MASSYHPQQHYEQHQPYPRQYPGYYQKNQPQQPQQQAKYHEEKTPPLNNASAKLDLSTILNQDDPSDDYFPQHKNAYPSAGASEGIPATTPDSRIGSRGSIGSNGASSSVMALHNALSPAVPSTPSTLASGPADNSFASVVFSDQRSMTSASDVTYTSHAHGHPQMYQSQDGHSMYASAEDFQKGKANLDYHYYQSRSISNESYSHEREQYTALDHGSTEMDRRASSRHHNAAANYHSYMAEAPGLGPPPASLRNEAETRQRKGVRGKKEQKSLMSQKGQEINSLLYATTPSSSSGTGVSSPAFSVPNTPGSQQTSRFVSTGTGTGNFESSEGEGEAERRYYSHDQENEDNASGSSSHGAREHDRNRERDTFSAQPPAVQRERNRMAATKCRAKSKAAITKLEEEERMMSDQRRSLVAQKSALVDEMLNLREQLLLHGSCESESGAYIKKYITNAAHTIADSGGKRQIWGSDGRGRPWTRHSYKSHDGQHGHVKKERK